MEEIVLERDRRLALRAAAHHLDPVVLLGANGLTEAVLKEIDRELTAHELIKVRVPTDDREEREAIFLEVAQKLGAARVQMIGKLLVLWRPSEEKEEEESEEDRRLAELFRGRPFPHDRGNGRPPRHGGKGRPEEVGREEARREEGLRSRAPRPPEDEARHEEGRGIQVLIPLPLRGPDPVGAFLHHS